MLKPKCIVIFLISTCSFTTSGSLVSSYSSFVETSDYKSHLMTGKFVFLEGNSLSLPVATTQGLINNNKLLITLSCALPD